MTVFVDSSYFVARLDARDQWNERARKADRPGLRSLTTSLVVNETLTLLQRRGRFSTALEFLDEICAAADIEIVYIDPALQAEAWDLFQRYGGAGASPADCASFAVVRRRGIRKAFTFDAHFRKAGFDILR